MKTRRRGKPRAMRRPRKRLRPPAAGTEAGTLGRVRARRSVSGFWRRRALLIPLSPLGMALYENGLATPTKTDMVVEHYGNGGLVGCVPFSMEMVAVEIHYGGEAAAREVTSALGAGPLAVDESTRVGHWRSLWFPSNRREYNRKWKTPSGGGEIHGDFSCVIVWDPAAVWRAKLELDRTPDPRFVKIRKLFPTRAETERRRRAGKDAGPAWDQGDPVFVQARG